MSSKLPSREQALSLLKEKGCPPKVIAHCKAVARLAVETAKKCQKSGVEVDLELVEIGALLHDIGRSKTHSVNHVVAGVEVSKESGLPESVIRIIKRHIGGGITEAEAEKLGWPKDNYMPTSIEEKIVSYADKLVETSYNLVPIELTITKLRKEKLNVAAERVRKIHDEITKILEDSS